MVDVFGFLCVGIGVSWFVVGKGVILMDFFVLVVEVVVCMVGGVVLMIWVVICILCEIVKQVFEMQECYDVYIVVYYLDKVCKLFEDGQF